MTTLKVISYHSTVVVTCSGTHRREIKIEIDIGECNKKITVFIVVSAHPLAC